MTNEDEHRALRIKRDALLAEQAAANESVASIRAKLSRATKQLESAERAAQHASRRRVALAPTALGGLISHQSAQTYAVHRAGLSRELAEARSVVRALTARCQAFRHQIHRQQQRLRRLDVETKTLEKVMARRDRRTALRARRALDESE